MTFADKLSVLRIILIPVFLAFLFYSKTVPFLRYMAFATFIIAVLSDFFDGMVARIKKEKSDIGMVLDPLADKLLLSTVFISLYVLRAYFPEFCQIPLWVVLAVVSRDIIIFMGIWTLSFLKTDIVIAPSLWGKLTTVFQMGTIFSVLLEASFSPYVWTAAVFCTLISGVGYFKRGVDALNAVEGKKHI